MKFNNNINKFIKNKNYDELTRIYFENEYDDKINSIITKFFLKNKEKFPKLRILFISNSNINFYFNNIEKFFLLNKYNLILENITFDEYIIENSFNKNKYDCLFLFFDFRNLSQINSFNNDIFFKLSNLKQFKDFFELLNNKLNQNKVKFKFISNIASIPNDELGNLSFLKERSKKNLIFKLNNQIHKLVNKHKYILFDNFSLSNNFGLNNYFDDQKYYIANIPFSYEYANIFSRNLYQLIQSATGNIKKVLVLDLDNTIWNGVLADDGIENIEMSEDTKVGKIFHDFQKIILNFKNKGVILAVSSKNDLKNVLKIFKNKKMVLKENDISIFKVNWREKYKNIIEISKELNLSLDSFVFIDDNPIERNQVRYYLPEVTVPELSTDFSTFSKTLLDSNFFETINLTVEDISRSKSYVAKRKYNEIKNEFSNPTKYLKNIKMKSKLSFIKEVDIDRITQMFQRTNQFNMTNLRYSSSNIFDLIKNKNFYCFKVNFKDKFLDYGIISSLVLENTGSDLIIKNWIMSCRVFGRSLEQYIINNLVQFFKQKNINSIIVSFKHTKKNIHLRELLINLKFQEIAKNKFKLNLKNFKKLVTYIN